MRSREREGARAPPSRRSRATRGAVHSPPRRKDATDDHRRYREPHMTLKMGLPKGSLEAATLDLMRRAGFLITVAQRSYLSLIHISEPTRLGMISYAVFCLKKKKKKRKR